MIVNTYPAVVNRDTFKRYSPIPLQQQQPRTQMQFPTQGDAVRPNEKDKLRAKQFMIHPDEFVRRDMIVRQLYLDTALFYKPGEVVSPGTDQAQQEYGHLSIRGVFKSYHDFPTAEAQAWPKDDIPYIFTVEPEKKVKGDVILCTAEFFKPVKK